MLEEGWGMLAFPTPMVVLSILVLFLSNRRPFGSVVLPCNAHESNTQCDVRQSSLSATYPLLCSIDTVVLV